MSSLRRIVSVAFVVVLAAFAWPVAASASDVTAAAAEECRGNTKAFTNGSATAQRNITMKLCIQRVDHDTVRAYAEMHNGAKAGSANIFYHFIINVRLERHDTVLDSRSCTATASSNIDTYGYMLTCATAFKTTTATGGWSADGIVSYDIIGDGKGDLTWNLYGSPVIS